MHTHTNAQGLTLVRVAPLNRAYLVRFTSISDADKRRSFDDDFGEEEKNSDSDVDDKGGIFPTI